MTLETQPLHWSFLHSSSTTSKHSHFQKFPQLPLNFHFNGPFFHEQVALIQFNSKSNSRIKGNRTGEIMSSSYLSNLSVSLPFAPEKSTGSKLPRIGAPSLLRLTGGSRGNGVKAFAAGEGRENLDYLQRASKQQNTQPPQQQPKRRVAPVAPIGLWDRFPTARTVQQMMETMESMMEDPFAYSSTWPSPTLREEGGYRGGRTPWEIKEGENEYKMRFDMPGMTKNDVKVWVEEKMLVVKAEKVPKKKESEGQKTQAESELVNREEEEWSTKSYGRYNSRIALPENIDFEKIKAEVKDGVLYITIPKASATSKVLDISVQ